MNRPSRASRVVPSITAAALALAAVAHPVVAQEGGRRVLEQSHAWLVYDGDHAFSSRWGVQTDVQARRADFVSEWQQLLVRGGLRYFWMPNLSASAGYAYVRTSPYGDEPSSPALFPEHRAWEQLQLRAVTGRVVWTHRYRLEQRWVAAVTADGDVADWRYSNRARYMVRTTVPFRGTTIDAGEPFAAASIEPFLAWGGNVRGNVFDQSRAIAALGWQLTRATRVEVGYLQQLLLRADGRTLERNHTLHLTLGSTAPLSAAGRRAVR